MKRYFAPDSRQAMKELREELGPDAIILSNRQVNGGVEIISAIDYEDAMENTSFGTPENLTNENEQFSNNQHRDSFSVTQHSTSIPVSEENEAPYALSRIQDELKGLRNIMEAPLMQMAWGEMNRVQPLYARLLKQLMTMGLAAKLSQVIAKKMASNGLNKKSWKEALKLLANIVPICDEDILMKGGTVSLIGPTGVGKTTTIAKLAARFALKHGRSGVNLITTDNYRVGAHEQLRTYGRILGIPVHVASDTEELQLMLRDLRNKSTGTHLTLIDTAGVCQNDRKLTEQLSTLNIPGENIKNYLVLSATGQINLLDKVIRAFGHLKLEGCVLTKTDEAASLGEVISVLIQHKLPLSLICDGQKVPDDVHRAHGKLLIKQAVELMKQSKQSPTVEELAYTLGGMVNHAHI